MPRKPETPGSPSRRERAQADEQFRQAQTERREALGQQVRALRQHRGLDQADLAAAAGLSRPYVAAIEGGNKNVTLDTLWALADGLSVNPAEFFIDEPLEWE